jgi:hypothetical protein
VWYFALLPLALLEVKLRPVTLLMAFALWLAAQVGAPLVALTLQGGWLATAYEVEIRGRSLFGSLHAATALFLLAAVGIAAAFISAPAALASPRAKRE